MIGCKYKELLKCSDCKEILWRNCKKFVIAHAKEISRELLPFVYTSKFKPQGKIMWSKDQNRAKSLALQCALKSNFSIKKITLSQAITLALNNEQIEDKVVYIECLNKLNGDVDKLKGVLISFIEACLLNNTVFVIYVAPTVSITFDYPKI